MSQVTQVTKDLEFNKYEVALVKGDLASLNDTERLDYVNNLCKSLNLNPLTKPFEYITLNGKLTLYTTKSATDQLRTNYKVSFLSSEKSVINDILSVVVKVKTPDGREDFATGAVSIKGLGGDNLANAIMKAETKAKRRATLSICGLGFLDESELESIKEKSFLPQKSELEILGTELRAFLSENGLSEKVEQNAFIKEKALFTTTAIKHFLNETDNKEQIKTFKGEAK